MYGKYKCAGGSCSLILESSGDQCHTFDELKRHFYDTLSMTTKENK